MKNYYAVLEVDKGALAEEIKKRTEGWPKSTILTSIKATPKQRNASSWCMKPIARWGTRS